jgi:hypothetical protein
MSRNNGTAIALGHDSIGSSVDQFELIARTAPEMPELDNSTAAKLGRVSKRITGLRRDLDALARIRGQYGLGHHRTVITELGGVMEEETLVQVKYELLGERA